MAKKLKNKVVNKVGAEEVDALTIEKLRMGARESLSAFKEDKTFSLGHYQNGSACRTLLPDFISADYSAFHFVEIRRGSV